MNAWINTRIIELKIWLKVSTVICCIAIFACGLEYLWLGYRVNFGDGAAVFWANPDVENQLAMLPEAPPKPAKKGTFNKLKY